MQTRIQYSGAELRLIGLDCKQKLESSVWLKCKHLGLVKGTQRGKRGGKKLKPECAPAVKTLKTDSVVHTHTLSQPTVSDYKHSSTYVKFGHLNAQSVRQKETDIHDLILDNDFDIFFLTETWLKERGDEVTIAALTPAGYKFEQNPRSGRGGGGVCVLYKSHLKVTVLKKQIQYRCIEYLVARLTLSKQTLEILCLYRLQTSKKYKFPLPVFYENLSSILESVVSKDKLLILGDLNIHFDAPKESATKKVLEVLDSHGLCQLVDVPTQRFGHTIDVVIVRKSSHLVKSIEVEDHQISDHYVQFVQTDLSRPKQPKKTVLCRNLTGVDTEQFREDLVRSKLLSDPPSDVEELAELYDETLSQLLDKHAPLVRKRVVDRKNCEWFNEEVKKAKEERRLAENRWRKSKLEVHRQIYKTSRNNYSQTVKRVKTEYIKEQLASSSGNSRKTQDIVDRLLGKDSASPVLPLCGEVTAANTLSSFFVDKIKDIQLGLDDAADTLSDVEKDYSVQFSGLPLTEFSSVDEGQLRKVILKSKKTSCELDPAPTKFLLQFLEVLLPVLVLIINLSLKSGQVPKCFKKAVVKPLLKKSGLDPNISQHYRPVSNLSFVSKLLEKVVADQLINHLNVHGCLDKYQSAYRVGFSTETALLCVVNDILLNLNSGNLVLLVLLDLSAAFDTINHQLLLNRLLCEAGISETALRWFTSYLADRTQSVVVGSSSSAPSALSCGVPQGSVLGPILFSLYTSQLGRVIEHFNVDRQLFADDTQLLNSFPPNPDAAKKAVERVESCCLAVKSWMTRNRLKLNDDKTEVILFGSKVNIEKSQIESVQVGDAAISLSTSARDLGLILDSELSMVDHVSSVVRNCYYQLRILGKLRPMLTRELANEIALATVMSRIDYCNSTFWGLPATQLNRLQKVQNIAARIVTRTKQREHITPVLDSLHWLQVHKRIDFKILSLTYACMNKSAPEYLQERIPVYEPPRCLRSCSQSRLRLPSVDDTKKKRSGARAFNNAGPKLWNSLPETVKKAETAAAFKKRLKTYLFSSD